LEATARSAADLLGIQPNTAIIFYQEIRQVIAWCLSQESTQMFDGDIELDESYFGGIRKGKRGRRAAGKAIAFGILNASWQGLHSGGQRHQDLYPGPLFPEKSSLTAWSTPIPTDRPMR